MTLEEYNALKPGIVVEVNIIKLGELLGDLSKIKKVDGGRIVGRYLGGKKVSIPLKTYPYEIILNNITSSDLIDNVNNANKYDIFNIDIKDLQELFICDEPARLVCDYNTVQVISSDTDPDGYHGVSIADTTYDMYLLNTGNNNRFKIRFINGFNISDEDDIKRHPLIIDFYHDLGSYSGSIPADKCYLLSNDSVLCDLKVPSGKISFIIERNKASYTPGLCRDSDEDSPSSFFVISTNTGINLGGDSHD